MARIGKPAHEKARAGNPGKRPIGRAVLARSAPTHDLRPPDWLADPEARALWARHAPELHRVRLLAPVDADVAGRYYLHFAKWLQCQREIAREGDVIDVPMTGSTPDNPKFMKRMNPRLRIAATHEAECVAFEDRFGGNATSRYRLMAAQAANPGRFGDLFGDEAAPEPMLPGEAAPSPRADSPFSHFTRPN